MALDRPLNQNEVSNNKDMLIGCYNRMCITDDKAEFWRLYSSALSYLTNIIAHRSFDLFSNNDRKGV